MLTFSSLRKANLERLAKVFHHSLEDWSLTDWACAVGGETGELLNKIKKLRRGRKIAITALAEEIADIVIYLDLLSARLGILMEKAVREKFNQVSKKKRSKIRI